ncbi:U-box domain-containing protein 34 [Ananas comosus]|uniref:RING-type E3 ubiquitin transferase n=1 Tax=Ananas comosus TaxID=4615 RepID=A0A199UH71_ANACO|nr:U-box domain-containing protein 34 [Ananas comosus]
MASVSGGGAAEATVAVAVSGGGRSRRAARWAAEHLLPHADRVLLIHVIPVVTSIPSPSGHRIPIERMEREVVEMYVQDVKSKSQQVFSTFKRLCGRRNVETLVLEGENPAVALLRYVSECGDNLYPHHLLRIFKRPDVATVLLKSAPCSCNIFAVSKRHLSMKFANDPFVGGNNMQIQKISHKAFVASQKKLIFDKQSLYGSQDSETLQKPALVEASSYPKFSSDGSASIDAGQGSENALMIPHNGDLHEKSSNEAPVEAVKLRIELQNTLAMYNRACDDLIHAKKKIHLLSAECSGEAEKVKDALEREKMLNKVVAEEKAKHLKAMKEVEQAKELLAKEVLDRHKAEIAANRVSSEKSRVVEAFLSSERRCRRYSRNEIEVATDNFSDTKKIGEGSYGDVYKCSLDHTAVAVKVEILSQLRHPHMLLLLGFCPENGCLVYEYMENGSLEDQLFYNKGKEPLPWNARFRIIFEVACGLAFLHGTKPEPIVHRDLKPGNILLDRNYVSKIGDVGLAKLVSDVVPDGLTEYKETILAGTLYYMDPEYQRTGTIRPKSDLYALGIIALQILTAKHPNGLVVSVENAIKGGTFLDVLDKSLTDWPVVEAEKLARLALKCSRLRCRDRPDLESEVLPELEELFYMSNVCFKLRKSIDYAPSHYYCPILKEIMDDPYIAADGYTYEYRAIKAWLEKHMISPVTKHRLSHSSIMPNHALRSAIQEWKARAAFLNS